MSRREDNIQCIYEGYIHDTYIFTYSTYIRKSHKREVLDAPIGSWTLLLVNIESMTAKNTSVYSSTGYAYLHREIQEKKKSNIK